MNDFVSQFLFRIAYQQDERSRQNFDAGLRGVQGRAAEFGARIGALPTIVTAATKKISSSLTDLYYASQKTGATTSQIDALMFGAKQSGEGADKAAASWEIFSQKLRDTGPAAVEWYKDLLNVVVDPANPFPGFLEVRKKLAELRSHGGQDMALANAQARELGIDEDSLVKGRLAESEKWMREHQERNKGIDVEAAVTLTRAFESLGSAFSAVKKKSFGALSETFVVNLNIISKWIDDNQEGILSFVKGLIEQISLFAKDMAAIFSPAVTFLYGSLKEIGKDIELVLGDNESGGLRGVRYLLEFISTVVISRFAIAMAAGFATAFGPVTALLAVLAAAGIIAYNFVSPAQGAVNPTGGIPGSPGAMVGGNIGIGATQRGAGSPVSGSSSARGGSGGGRGGGTGSAGMGAPVTGAQQKANRKETWDFLKGKGLSDNAVAAIIGSEQGESNFNPNAVGDQGASKGSFQWDATRRAAILKNTGIDVQTATHRQQLEAMWWETHHGDAGAQQAMRVAKDPNASVDDVNRAWVQRFERSGNQPRDITIRGGHANRALKDLGGGKSSIPDAANLNPEGWRKRLDDIKNAPPIFEGQKHSSNEVNDHRSVSNDVNIHVANGGKTEIDKRPIGRSRLANTVRNTASFAS